MSNTGCPKSSFTTLILKVNFTHTHTLYNYQSIEFIYLFFLNANFFSLKYQRYNHSTLAVSLS